MSSFDVFSGIQLRAIMNGSPGWTWPAGPQLMMTGLADGTLGDRQSGQRQKPALLTVQCCGWCVFYSMTPLVSGHKKLLNGEMKTPTFLSHSVLLMRIIRLKIQIKYTSPTAGNWSTNPGGDSVFFFFTDVHVEPPTALVWVNRNLPESELSGKSSGGLPRRLPISSRWEQSPTKSVLLEDLVFSYLWFSTYNSSEVGAQFGRRPGQMNML